MSIIIYSSNAVESMFQLVSQLIQFKEKISRTWWNENITEYI